MDAIQLWTRDQSTNAPSEEPVVRIREAIIGHRLYLFIMFVNMGVVCQTITVFGTVSNVITIVVFVKQGFKETVNISLLALSVSDLMSLLFLAWSNLCFSFSFKTTSYLFVCEEVHIITGGWPHLIFTHTSGWITAFISFERCMCVIFPLKVKTIFTKRRHVISILVIFIDTISCSTLAYVSAGLGWKFYPDRNATLVGLVYRMDVQKRKVTDTVSYAVNGLFMPMTCFFAVLVFTVILVVKLNQQAVWRKANFPSTENKSLNTRDKKAAKMIVFISVIFIVSYIPAVGIFIAGYLEPQLSYDGVQRNLFMVALSVSFTAEAFNSSINIFIYFKMSVKYRESFLAILK